MTHTIEKYGDVGNFSGITYVMLPFMNLKFVGTWAPAAKIIPTFLNRCLSAIGGEKQWSRLAGWVQLSAEAAPGPHGVPPTPPSVHRSGRWELDDAGNLHK